ncbi:hypothetical protein [Mucilaginibacter gilvus]|nr:hypothetical protein [Mucilaginibacter gilvus]
MISNFDLGFKRALDINDLNLSSEFFTGKAALSLTLAAKNIADVN